jgi:hypothetical protein
LLITEYKNKLLVDKVILRLGIYISAYLFFYFLTLNFFKIYDGNFSAIIGRISIYLTLALIFSLEITNSINRIEMILKHENNEYNILYKLYFLFLSIYIILTLFKVTNKSSGEIYFWITPFIIYLYGKFKNINTKNLKIVYLIFFLLGLLSLIHQYNKNTVLNPESYLSINHIGAIDEYLYNNKINNPETFQLKDDFGNVEDIINEKDLCKFYFRKESNFNSSCLNSSLVDKLKLIKNNAKINESDFKYLLNNYYDSKVLNKLNLFYYFVSTPGFVFHHYQTINNANFSLTENQYGLGPQVIINFLSKYFHLTTFDSIYRSYQFIEILFYFLIFIATIRMDIKYRILFLSAAILSNSSIGYTSQYLAPLLFSIRYLPNLILVFYLTIRILNNNNNQPINFSKADYFIILFLLLLILVNNIEYGFFTFLAIFIAGIITNNKKFKSFGFVCVIGYFIIALLKYYSGSNLYSNHLTFSGIPQKPDLLVYSFTIANIFTILYSIYFTRSIFKNVYFTTIFLILQLFWLKVVWINSGNHVGYLFFILICVIMMINHLALKKNYIAYLNLLIFISLSISQIYIFTQIKNNIGENFKFLTYNKSSLSNYIKLESYLGDKLLNFKINYLENDFVISGNDAALSLFANKKITVTPDIASYITHSNNYDVILKSLPSNRRVVVDKSIYEYRSIISNTIFFESTAHKSQYNKLINLSNNIILSQNFKKCGENIYFIYYCPQY